MTLKLNASVSLRSGSSSFQLFTLLAERLFYINCPLTSYLNIVVGCSFSVNSFFSKSGVYHIAYHGLQLYD